MAARYRQTERAHHNIERHKQCGYADCQGGVTFFVRYVLYVPYKHSPLYKMIKTIISLFGYNNIARTEKLSMVRLAGEFLSLILHKIFGRIKQVFLV